MAARKRLDRSRHPSDKALGLTIVNERDPHRPVAGPARTLQRTLNFIKIDLLELRSTHQRCRRLSAGLAATTTSNLHRRPALKVGELQVYLPIHQKSSARGMRA